jgi:O-antigen/teichoic acid export membrane protein
MRRHIATASRLFGSAIVDQAMLSGASLLAGLMLVRHAADLQYGYYVLAWNAILLLSSMQNAFFGPPMVNRLSRLDRDGGRAVVGGLYSAQRRILPLLAALSFLGILVGWGSGALPWRTAVLAAVVTVAAVLVLGREYFRMVLLAYRRPLDVLKGDAVYVAVMLVGVAAATLTSEPATFAILGLSLAAGAGALLMSRSLRRHEPWNGAGARGILREIAPLGAWSTLGAAVHWSFSQGYSYLVAGTLGVGAVAAVSATRLLLMPINLLSMGLGMVMLPLAAEWLNQHGAAVVLRRLAQFAAALVAAALLYFALLCQFRGWLFEVVLHKHFAQRDLLLSLWFAAFIIMVMRDQLIYLLVVRSRFRLLTALTLLSATLSLTAGYCGMRLIGEAGAPFGVAIGELVSVAGILICSIRECRTAPAIRAQAPLHLFPTGTQENAS